MTIPARGAAVRGDDYQYVHTWLWMMRALRGTYDVHTIEIEQRETGPFDDLVLRCHRPTRDRYTQIKSSNVVAVTLDETWLMGQQNSAPSPFQRLFALWQQTAELDEAERPELVLLANRTIDPAHPILGLADRYTGALPIPTLSAATEKSTIGKQIRAWSDHLNIDRETLMRFLADLRIEHGAAEVEIRNVAAAEMSALGLRADVDGVATGIDIVRDLVKTGRCRLTLDDIALLVTKRELHATHGNLVLAVHAVDRRPVIPPATATVDVVDMYEGDTPDERRQLRDPENWAVVDARVKEAVQRLERYRLRNVYVTGSMRLPLWFAIGASMPDVRGWTLSMAQRDQRWTTAASSSPELTALESHRETITAERVDVAVVLALTRDPTAEVADYVRKSDLPVRELLTIGGSLGVGQDAVPDDMCAVGWWRTTRELLLQINPRPNRLHLFFACPSGVALIAGHNRNLLPAATLYEHLMPGYAPTISVG